MKPQKKNQRLKKNNITFLNMKQDAKNGREFNDIIVIVEEEQRGQGKGGIWGITDKKSFSASDGGFW